MSMAKAGRILLVAGLVVLTWDGGPVGAVDEPVKSKFGAVTQTDQLDYQEDGTKRTAKEQPSDADATSAESTKLENDLVEIQSKTFTPPGKLTFKPFGGEGGPWVDFEVDPTSIQASEEPVEGKTKQKALKVKAVNVPLTAGTFPLQCEGNLKGGGGGGGGGYTVFFHWSAKVNKVLLRIVRCYDSENTYNSVYRKQQDPSHHRLFLMEDDASGTMNPRLEIALSGGTDRAKVIWRIMDGATKMAEGNFGAGLDVPSTFTVTAACKDYVVQVGIDDDNDTHLSDAEAASYAWVVLDNTSSRPMITAFRQPYYGDAYEELEDCAWLAEVGELDFSSTLLWYFLANYVEANILPQLPIPYATVAAADAGLTHAVGASPTAGSNSFEGADNSYELVFNASSSPSDEILDSGPFADGVNGLLTTKKADIRNAFAVPGSPDEQVFNYALDKGVTFEKPSGLPLPTDALDLYYAFHGAQITAALQVTVKRQGGGLTLARLRVSGETTDLYDFNYEQGGLFQAGATLQIGWDTAKGRNAGKIFLVKVLLDYTFDNTDLDPFNNWSFDLN